VQIFRCIEIELYLLVDWMTAKVGPLYIVKLHRRWKGLRQSTLDYSVRIKLRSLKKCLYQGVWSWVDVRVEEKLFLFPFGLGGGLSLSRASWMSFSMTHFLFHIDDRFFLQTGGGGLGIKTV